MTLEDFRELTADLDGDTERNEGTVIATEVTVPLVAGAAQTGTPPETVRTLPVDPIANLEAVFAPDS